MASKNRKMQDVATGRSATFNQSGARDRGGRIQTSRVWTQGNGKAKANKAACRKGDWR